MFNAIFCQKPPNAGRSGDVVMENVKKNKQTPKKSDPEISNESL